MFHRTNANPTNAQGTRRTRGALRVSEETLFVQSVLFYCLFVCSSSDFFFALHRSAHSSSFQDVSNQRNDDNGVKNGKANVNKRGLNNNSSSFPLSRSSDNAESLQRGDTELSTTSNSIHNNIPLVSQGSIPSGNFMPADDCALSGYQYSGPADNIDERDTDDPLCVTSYVQDMYEHFRSKEATTSVRPVYMDEQQYINERMRSILVDWLVEVHLKFKLVPETLYLTVNIIDRYLAQAEVTRPKLQLVGVTALLIASKYEEIYPPELRDLVYICDRAYSKNEVRKILDYLLSIAYSYTRSHAINLSPTLKDP
jgi:hypothetical protein